MTTLYLVNIADSIASISITGVSVKDKDQVAASWAAQPNVLYPNPDNWIIGFRAEYNIAGNLETASYTLNYRFLHVQVSDIATFPAGFSGLADKVGAVIGALVDVLNPYSDNVDMTIADAQMGPRDDPAGNQYFGADIALAIIETH
jgi:hypothetical protein